MKKIFKLELFRGKNIDLSEHISFYEYALEMEKISRLQMSSENKINIDCERHISDLSFSADASLLAAVSQDNLISVFNLRTGKIKDIIYSRTKLYHKEYFYDKTICFADNERLLAISDNGVSLLKIGKNQNNFNYFLPKFFTALTFDRYEKRLHGLSTLYVGDSWGHISQLDINDGKIVRTIYRFEDEIINKIAIAKAKLYLAVITYTPSQQYKLSILINKYTQIAYKTILTILPDDLFFSEKNTLILSWKCYDFEYKISKQFNKLKLEFSSSEPKPKLEKPLPAMIPEKIIDSLCNIKDWEYSDPYFILIGIYYNLMCWKLDYKKPRLLWALGSIGNNFKHSIFYKNNNVPAKKRDNPVENKKSLMFSWEIRSFLNNITLENKNSFIERKQTYEKLKSSGDFPQNIFNPGVK